MRHVAAYMLAALGGNTDPSAKDIKSILASVGVDADDKALTVVIDQLKGKNLDELIESGMDKLATMPAGGGAAPAAVGSAPAVATADAPSGGGGGKAKEPEPEEESDDDMGMGLFD